MPNWCHNTLTVTGPEEELGRFVRRVMTSEQPLSFAQIAPEPSKDVYEMVDNEHKQTCVYCAGTRKRPLTQEQADELGVEFFPAYVEAVEKLDKQPTCNVCDENGKAPERGWMGAWYEWRLQNWGCKWDASFDGPFMAMGAEGADPEACADAMGSVLTPTAAVYKFDTPWSPPVPFICWATVDFPELHFSLQFGEPGNGFAGIVEYKAGQLLREEELEVEDVLAPEEMWF